MSQSTSIEWTDATWNPTRGCSKVSEGCRSCYAMRVAARFSGPGQPYEGLARMTPRGPEWTGEVRFVEDALGLPLTWRKPRRVFVDSMSDLFHDKVTDSTIFAVFQVMERAKQHTFQVLTKRPERMASFVRRLRWRWNGDGTYGHMTYDARGDGAPMHQAVLPNVWLGVSVENQAAADERIPLLMATPASVRFLSCEPLLGPVDLRHFTMEGDTGLETHLRAEGHGSIHWVIVGGESGPGARPFELAWARSIVWQCREAGVAVFVKQLGARPVLRWAAAEVAPVELRDRKGGDMAEWPEDLRVRQFPGVTPRA